MGGQGANALRSSSKYLVLGTKFEDLPSAGVVCPPPTVRQGFRGPVRHRHRCCGGASMLQCQVCPGQPGRHDRLRLGRTPPRYDTCFVPKFGEIFRRRRYCHEGGGGVRIRSADLRTSYLVRGTERGATRLSAVAGSTWAPAHGRGWSVRAADLRNTQCRSISAVSSRRDPGAPRLQNPHPPLRFRFAQPSCPSTSYWVLRCSLRSHAARRLRRRSGETKYSVLRTEYLELSA